MKGLFYIYILYLVLIYIIKNLSNERNSPLPGPSSSLWEPLSKAFHILNHR